MAHSSSRYEMQWPELFEGLESWQRRALNHRLANASLEGWTPTEHEVRDLIESVRHITDRDVFWRQTLLSFRIYK